MALAPARLFHVHASTQRTYRIPALYILHLHIHQTLGQLPDFPLQACGLCDRSFAILQPFLQAQVPQAAGVSCTETGVQAGLRARIWDQGSAIGG